MDPPLMSATVQAVLIITNGVFALFLLVLAFAVRRLVKDLDDNTIATDRLANAIGELQTSMARFYVTKIDFDAQEVRISRFNENMTTKFDILNREMGEMKARLEYAVKHKEY